MYSVAGVLVYRMEGVQVYNVAGVQCVMFTCVQCSRCTSVQGICFTVTIFLIMTCYQLHATFLVLNVAPEATLKHIHKLYRQYI